MQWPDLTEVLTGVDWAVVGAVATRLYMPERMTRDLDILIHEDDAPRVREVLRSAGWLEQGPLSIGGSSWRTPADDELDVLLVSESWWRQALREAQTNRDASGLPILPLPYLVLMKFRASRTVDIGDMARMLGGASDPNLAATRRLFARLEPEGLEDLESLIELGRWEVQGTEADRRAREAERHD